MTETPDLVWNDPLMQIKNLRQYWAWKPSDSQTYFVERDQEAAFAGAERRNQEAAQAAAKLTERRQVAENEQAAKAKPPREPQILPPVEPLTYSVHTYWRSEMSDA